MPKLDIASLPVHTGTGYPAPFKANADGRSRIRLGNAGELDQFGVNLCTLQPGAKTALRHWHHNQDEFAFILEGEATLIEDNGETPLNAGEAATFKAGVANGHCIVNNSDAPVVLLEVGTRTDEEIGEYPDDDLKYVGQNGSQQFTHKDGTPY